MIYHIHPEYVVFSFLFNCTIYNSNIHCPYNLTLANSTILVKYTEGSVTLSKEITNYDLDQIVLTDGREGDLSANKLLQPSSLSTKILSLISNVSSNIDGIQSFFTNND